MAETKPNQNIHVVITVNPCPGSVCERAGGLVRGTGSVSDANSIPGSSTRPRRATEEDVVAGRGRGETKPQTGACATPPTPTSALVPVVGVAQLADVVAVAVVVAEIVVGAAHHAVPAPAKQGPGNGRDRAG